MREEDFLPSTTVKPWYVCCRVLQNLALIPILQTDLQVLLILTYPNPHEWPSGDCYSHWDETETNAYFFFLNIVKLLQDLLFTQTLVYKGLTTLCTIKNTEFFLKPFIALKSDDNYNWSSWLCCGNVWKWKAFVQKQQLLNITPVLRVFSCRTVVSAPVWDCDETALFLWNFYWLEFDTFIYLWCFHIYCWKLKAGLYF